MAQEIPAWVVPVLSLAANAILSPILLFFLSKRKEKREDKTTDANIYLELMKFLQVSMKDGVAEKQTTEGRYKELLASYEKLILDEPNRRKPDQEKIEALERELANNRGEVLSVCRKIAATIQTMETISEIIEPLKDVGTIEEKATQIIHQIDAIITKSDDNIEELEVFLQQKWTEK